MKELLVFSHIPKTAGTSFNYLLRGYFGSSLMAARHRGNVNATYTGENLISDSRYFRNLRCVSGHSVKPFEPLDMDGYQLRWFTFLRNPVNRLISHYIHQFTSNVELYNVGIEEWMGRFNRSNLMTRHIAGEEDVQAAIEILSSQFSFVGFTEYFEDSLSLFKETFHLDCFSSTLNKARMTVRDNDLKESIYANESILNIIRENNALDIELYDKMRIPFLDKRRNMRQENAFSIDNQTKLEKGNFKFQLQDKLVYNVALKLDSAFKLSK